MYSMEPNNTTAETCSTNESQDISSSQQESTVSDGPYGYDDGNESSSLRDSPHEEVVNSAIMEVSGELMLGKLTPNKHPSAGSESSDISDDDARLHIPGGAIAKYPESSTGLSDNDWNPYATESDTNQTPRSPRSNTSEDNKVGFVSKANINMKAVSDKNRTPVTTEGPDFAERTGQKVFTDKEYPHKSISVNGIYSPEQTRSDNEDLKQYASLLSERENLERESPDTAPDTARSAYTEDSRSGRQSSDSLRSEEYKRESIDSQALQSEPSYARQSLESGPLDNLRRISAESARSIESGDNSSQPSVETVRNVRNSPTDFEKTAESNHSGRHSVESYHSHLSDRSRKSDLSDYTKTSNPRPASIRNNRSDRLELLSEAAGDSLKELMEFESSQRPSADRNGLRDVLNDHKRKNYPVSSTRLTAKVHSNMSGDQNPSGYITVAERERLISESPVQDQSKSQNPVERRSFEKDKLYDFSERSKPAHSETNLPSVGDQPFGRSPSEVSMRRVSNLFEETKRQVREAVALQRPDPSGSEERFPLRERLSWNQHDASFISQAANYSGELEDKNEDKLEKSRESEAARSLTSEEVARVLSKYSEFDADDQSKLKDKSKMDSDSRIKVSAFDSVERSNDINGHINGEGSDDELSKRVKAILANSNTHTSNKLIPVRENRPSDIDYVPNTIDYSRLHRDLEEIQDSLHDIPKTKANDSLPLHLRNGTDYQDSPVPSEFVIKSMETTGSGVTRSQESGITEYNGRESGASEYGRRLVWDHGADLQYDQEYDGKFLGTNTSSDTLSQSRRKYLSDEADTLVVRPDSVMTNGTDNDLESEGTKTLTGSDITRAERLVKQVLNRQAEGDLEENVEDIIARYRDEKKDLYDRYQSLPDTGQISEVTERGIHSSKFTPVLPSRADVQRPVSNYDKEQKEMGLAERVYKILSAETDNPYDTPNEQGDNKGMATTVSNILARGRPQEQVNGILTEALTQENEMLKKITARDTPRMTDSSLEDSGMNDTEDSLTVEDADIRKRLQWSQLSSPEKGNKSYMSDFSALREVTKAPYSSVNNAKTLLSTQLKKMSERNFDKSIELRTPFRQTVECWPVHGVERTRDGQSAGREAWMPRHERVPLDNEKKTFGSERFYITDRDQQSDMRRQRTYSDPFEVSQSHISQPGRDLHPRSRSEEPHDVSDLSQYSELPRQYSPTARRTASSSTRDLHPRSRSEEPHDVSDLSQYSELPRQYSPTARRTASSSTRLSRQDAGEFMTPKSHKPEEWSYEYYTSPSDSSGPLNFSDSSGCHGNKWHFHSYQGPDKMTDPENDKFSYDGFQRSPSVKSAKHFRSRSLDRHKENKSPVKMSARSLERHSRKHPKSIKVKFNTPKKHNDVGPHNISEFSERRLINRIARRNDDVYNLLTDKNHHDLNVHELKTRLNDLQQERAKSKKLATGNYGNSPVGMATARPQKSIFLGKKNLRPVTSPTDSDTSGSRRAARPRPYRPAGRGDMYYTESGDDTNESGTTIESTHPGSDDAVPPYIPRQYLGSRKDEPNKHPTGIYGVNNKPEDLSTIDENSVKDDKEKALSVSTGSNKGEKTDDKEQNDKLGAGRTMSANTQLAETGYQTRSTIDALSRMPDTRTLDSGYPSKTTSSKDNLKKEHDYPGATGVGAGQPSLKSREEFLREFEEREQERRRYSGEHRDQMGTSVRSDPGGTLEDMGPRREYRESTDRNEFQVLEPEPGYPQERLRYSRSRSDTDLVSLSPTESQKYSSPMQPGTRFMELSTQPSPIFHQDSLTTAPRHRTGQDIVQGQARSSLSRHSPLELPRVDDRQGAPELPRVDDRSSSGGRRGEAQTESLLVSREEPVRPLEPGTTNARTNVYPRSQELMNPVDLGADPGRLGDIPRSSRPRTPVYQKEKEMEAELEKMNKELSDQVKEIQEGNTSKSEQNVEDTAPLSKKAQILRQVLEQEYVEGIPPNINDMWTRFKEKFDQSVSESSMGSTRLDALSGLIQNPTHHFVNSFLREKEEETEAQKKLSEERAEKIREERKQESERLKRLAEKRAADERSHRRLELRQKHGLSEEESNGSITELLVENEKRKEKSNKKDRKSGSPKKRKSPDKEKRDKKERKSQVDKETETNIKNRERPTKPSHSDTLDTLFSIPEDASFEQSPSKSESELRSRQRRQRHVIDPLMKKLRDKIKLQRDKIDKERRKELQRVEKLKKLEMLLNAKRKNHLSDKAIDVELQNVSTTTSAHSETTLMSTDNTVNGLLSSQDSEHSSEISTTLKDSTATPIKLQVKRYPELDVPKPKKHFVDTDSTESSGFSNIIVEKVPENRSEKRKSVRNSASREKSSKLDENGQRIRKVRKSGKKSKEVFGVEISPEDLEKQVQRYERYVSPERRRKLRDASTMYPSPITVRPPQQRRIRDVLMRSEAIQTSPSIRSSSPTYSYDEVPVAPVPTMSNISSGKKTLRRRPSPSPPRATSSRTVRVSPPRRTPKSPTARKSSQSPARPVSEPPAHHSRPRKDPPMWKPECESTPPENSMFTPEVDENVKPASKAEATAWFVPMKPSQPWRQPLKERQAFSVRQENWEPTSISQTKWKKMVHGDIHQEQGEPNDVSRDTKFDLDPEGQPINENLEEDSDITDLDLSGSKPLSKMSLQEAFMIRKQMTISRLRERQKRLNLAAEQRKMEAYLKMERDQLFSEERKKEANPEAHPYSENLYRPVRRIISKEEMKELTIKRYKKLPEVIEKEKLKKREEDYSLNRLKARLFNRKIQKQVLVKAHKWGR